MEGRDGYLLVGIDVTFSLHYSTISNSRHGRLTRSSLSTMAPRDDSVRIATEAGATMVRLDRNYGFAAAPESRGVETAQAEWIAILNNDVTLDSNWLETLLAAADEKSSFLTGKILSASRSENDRRDLRRDLAGRVCQWRCGAGKPDAPVWNRPQKIRMASMTAALFRRSPFSDIGPPGRAIRLLSGRHGLRITVRPCRASRALRTFGGGLSSWKRHIGKVA